MKMTVGVGGICSLTSEVLVNLKKGVPLGEGPTLTGVAGSELDSPSSGMTLRCSALILAHGSR
ncbi:hypothetical protein J6590_013019 [Homalodisca vitripennis]|nr:hypothetical protein J6590_013019 [Homalodisca vitripennis]